MLWILKQPDGFDKEVIILVVYEETLTCFIIIPFNQE